MKNVCGCEVSDKTWATVNWCVYCELPICEKCSVKARLPNLFIHPKCYGNSPTRNIYVLLKIIVLDYISYFKFKYFSKGK